MRIVRVAFLLVPFMIGLTTAVAGAIPMPAPLDQAEYLDADDWFQVGLDLNSEGKYNQAAEAFGRSIDIDPENPLAWLNLGTSQALSGELDSAIGSINKALAIDPRIPLAFANLGEIYFKAERYQEAVDAFSKLLTFWSNDPNAHYKLGLSYLFLKNPGKAQAEYLTLKILDPKLAEELLLAINQGSVSQ